ncbi:hypothetical protein ACIRRA_39820 [Nocardia sp. NPDC101769]|uniref:hypothetical protein n=1 Tax=Nocardia sp. NPDC101769 TaxID=3364333 RepID=UPI003829B6AD
MDDQQIDAEVARQLKALLAKTAGEKLAAALDADPELKRAIEERSERAAQAQLERLAAEAASPAPPMFDHLADWVENYLAYVYWRDVDGIDETAGGGARSGSSIQRPWSGSNPLYQRWRDLSGTPEGMLAWWDVADRMMGKLMARNGPYSRCTTAAHYGEEDGPKLACEPAPAELVAAWTAA